MRAVDGNHRFKGDQAWAAVMEHLHAEGIAAAARTQAQKVTAQARRDADAILAEARQQADRTAACLAEMVLDIEKDRRQAAELLAEARHEAESVRSEVAEIAEEARHSAREMLAKAQQQALLVLDDALGEAGQIRGRARRQSGVWIGADTQAGRSWARDFQDFVRASLEECTLASSGDVVDLARGAFDGPARRLPVTARPGGALERLSRVPLSFTGAMVLIVEGEANSTIPLWVRAPQKGDKQDGAEQTSTADARKKLPDVAVRCHDMPPFESADRACNAAPKAAWLDGARSLLGTLKADGEDAGDDAESGVKGVENCTGR
jgi:cell division septum initiation protein DivIVA